MHTPKERATGAKFPIIGARFDWTRAGKLLETAPAGRECPRTYILANYGGISSVVASDLILIKGAGSLTPAAAATKWHRERFLSLSRLLATITYIGLANKRDLHTRAYGVARHIMCRAAAARVRSRPTGKTTAVA